jgi:6-phosphofructokinase 2
VTEIRSLTLSPSLDLGAAIDRLDAFAKLRSDVATCEPGGGGVNVSRAVHRVGGRTRAIFAGDDYTGARLGTLLDAEGVPNTRVPCTAPTRENFAIWVRQSSENYHIVVPSPPLEGHEAEACLTALLAPAPGAAEAAGTESVWLVASGSLPPGVPEDFYARLARAAARQGMPLVLDTHGAPLRHALGEEVFLIKPSLQEFYDLIGEGDQGHLPLDERRLIVQARELMTSVHIRNLIITLGEGGALLVTRDDHVRAIAPRVRPVSPVGAGDSFLGVCVHALASGQPIREALFRGTAAGASTARTPAAALFRVDELDELTERTRQLSARVAAP